MFSIVMIAHGRDPYDHTKEIQYTFYQIDEVDLDIAKITGQRNIKDKAHTGWYSVTVLDTKTQRATPIFYAENPLLERLELNPAAKKAKGSFNTKPEFTVPSGLFVTTPTPISSWPHQETAHELEF